MATDARVKMPVPGRLICTMVASGRGQGSSLLQTDDAKQLIKLGLEKSGPGHKLHANEVAANDQQTEK